MRKLQTYSDMMREKAFGPDTETVRQRRSEAAQQDWAIQRARDQERRLEEMEARFEVFMHLKNGGTLQ